MNNKLEDTTNKVSNEISNNQLSVVTTTTESSQNSTININKIHTDIQNKLYNLYTSATAAASQVSNPVSSHWQKTVKPKFEIELYEEVTDDETGEIKGYKKIHSEHPIIIEAANKRDLDELAARYEFCHQKMKIVRKIDDGSQRGQANNENPASLKHSVQHHLNQTQDVQTQNSQTQTQSTTSVQTLRYESQKPKFYRIGDIDIKDDNGKIYQKQWMKLSQSEMSNLRVINDKNNSIVSLNGKHIEMKKWILVEKSEDDVTTLEEGIK